MHVSFLSRGGMLVHVEDMSVVLDYVACHTFVVSIYTFIPTLVIKCLFLQAHSPTILMRLRWTESM
jgi:hypothetical protein